MNVFRARLFADKDDLLAVGRELFRFIRIEHNDADCRARRSRQAFADDVAAIARRDRRMQQLIERRRIDTQHGFVFADQPFAHHVDGDLQRGFRGAFAVARLKHVERAALDRELQILHVAIVGFELLVGALKLGEHLRHRLLKRLARFFHLFARGFGQRLRRANAGDDIFALRVDQELAVERLGARARIARERNAGRARLAHIAKHHRLHIDGGAPAFGDVVVLAIEDRAIVHPACEHGAHRTPKLILRIGWEWLAKLTLNGALVFLDDGLPIIRIHLGVG